MEVVPIYLELLHGHAESLTQEQRFSFFHKVYKRLNEGMKKYGRPLVTNNGRDSLQDAWEEAIDGSQYLVQAYCEGKLKNPDLMHQMIQLSLQIQEEITIYLTKGNMAQETPEEKVNG